MPSSPVTSSEAPAAGATDRVPSPGTAGEILEAVAALAPAVAGRAAEIEEARQVPADLLDRLVAAGCYRLLVPRALGGAGAEPSTALRVYEELSRAEPSVGWTVMIGSGAWLDLVGLPGESFEALFRDGPDLRLAGVFRPSGVAVPVAGGYRVSGRWAFASGCPHSDWLYGNCLEEVDGGHGLRTVLFTADEVRIEDTWEVVGLRGTASHHFGADEVVVPEARTCVPFEGEPALADPIVRIPVPSMFALGIAAVALGCAQGALDEIAGVAAARTPLLAAAPLAGSALFRRDLAVADTELRAARALVHQAAGEAWATACAGEAPSLPDRARMRAAAVWSVERAVAAVHAAYRAGGGSALYLASPLQRRLRDISALGQHFLVRPDTMVTAGAVLAGDEPDVAVF